MRKIILGLIIAMSGVILFSQNTFADWVQQSTVDVSKRVYLYGGDGIGENGVLRQDSLGTRTIPFGVVGFEQGRWRSLIEVVFDKAVSDNSSDKFKYLMVDITMQQPLSRPDSTTIADILRTGFTLTTNKGDIYGSCVIKESGNDYTQWRCGAQAPENSTITHWYARIGDSTMQPYDFVADVDSNNNCATCNINPANLTYVSVNLTTTQDPAVSLLQQQISQNNTIINQNQTMISQNQQIIDSQNATNQWLQNSTPPNVDTSSLNTSVGWMPAGPVDSILTLPLQLLQGIINVFTNTNCSPLVVPVPYVNEDITLPCVSTLMDDIGFTPVWNIVGGVISAVIIWDTLKWLYRFVDDTLTFRENNSGMWGGL